jgi:hypothetical protein
MHHRCVRIAQLVASALLALPGGAQQAPLAVAESNGHWRGLWRPDSSPPTRWAAADSSLIASLLWKPGRNGISFAEMPIRGDGEAWRTRAIIARIDPRQVRFALDTSFRYSKDMNGAVMRGSQWRTQDATTRAILSVNAGQFYPTILGTLPWGWVVLNGREWRAPGVGPLSSVVIFDSTGGVQLTSPSTRSAQQRMRGVAWAFQSFPTLLDGDGEVPEALKIRGSIDLTHRDARVAIGVTRDGSLVIVMTRFDLFGPTLGAVPFGLTTPEMSALMGALGCARAVMLDGGISAQMQLRDARGATQQWLGWRRVPMGLLVLPR